MLNTKYIMVNYGMLMQMDDGIGQYNDALTRFAKALIAAVMGHCFNLLGQMCTYYYSIIITTRHP